MAETYVKYNWYRRYKVRAIDMTTLQTSVFTHAEKLAAGITKGSVMSGFDYLSATGLDVSVSAGIASDANGNILTKESTTIVNLPAASGPANYIRHLIVIRNVITQDQPIINPTNPFLTVPLVNTYQSQIAVVSGVENGAWPSKIAGDVILMGIEVSNTGVRYYDYSKCEYVGKLYEKDFVVSRTDKRATHGTLREALIDSLSAKRIFVNQDQAPTGAYAIGVSGLEIVLGPGIVIRGSQTATGFVVNSSEFRLNGGMVSGFTGAAVSITPSGSNCKVFNISFKSNTNDIVDGTNNAAIFGNHYSSF